MNNNLVFNDETPPAEIVQPAADEKTTPAATEPAPAPKKKDGRGRPRKIDSQQKDGPAAPKTNTPDDEAELKAKLGDFKPVNDGTTAGQPPTPEQQKTAIIISGAAFLSMVDFIAPKLILFVYSFIDDRAKHIKQDELKLTPSQIKELEQVAGEVSKIVFQDINPIAAFAVMVSVSYFANIEEAMLKAEDKIEKEKEAKKKKEKIVEL